MPESDGWCPFATHRPLSATGNFEKGRRGAQVKAVVMHIGEGPLSAFFPTFNNPARKASAHFTVGKQGEIEQYVSINDTAYANGLRWDDGKWFNPRGIEVKPSWEGIVAGVNPNYYTISVEHEGFFREKWTEPMYLANLALLKWLSEQTGLKYVEGETLIGHFHIDSIDRANCPGPNVEWDRMIRELNVAGRQALIAGANKFGIPLNDQAALARFAIQKRLGIPLTDEFTFTADGVKYVGQVWSQAIVYAKVGEFDKVMIA